jgi:polyphenol oxidase
VLLTLQQHQKLLNGIKFVSDVTESKFSQLPVEFGFVGKNASIDRNTHYVNQVHSNVIVCSSAATSQVSFARVDADGIYTSAYTAVAIKTADCLPIILTNKNADFVMAIHAGWRGLCCDILFSAFLMIKNRFKINPKEVSIFIGPCISMQNYEVGEDLVNSFRKSSSYIGKSFEQYFFKQISISKWNFDLRFYAIIKLLSFGCVAKKIFCHSSCTYSDPNYYSFRRDGRLGSNWTWIRRAY